MKSLRISPDLALPLTAVTSTHGILAIRGAGKSNVMTVLAEQMDAAGAQWVSIDVKGDWWGVRSSANGNGPGLAVPIFGGVHGDIPLEPTSGAFMAELIAEQRISCVLDLSDMTKGEQTRFLVDFGERLFRLKLRLRDPLHLFLDEADEYMPQKVHGDQARLVGAFARIVKQGRNRGIGLTLASQRSAVVNKDVLTQIETLIAMRTTSPQDRKAVLGWVETHAVGRDLVNTLPGLDDGEGWIWSPHVYKLMVRVWFDRRSTFDSGATPAFGEKLKPPKRLADVDLVAIKDRMTDTIERVKANDPRELQAEVRRLRAEVTRLKEDIPDVVTTTVTVETVDPNIVRGLTDLDRTIAHMIEMLTGDAAELIRQMFVIAGRDDREVSREVTPGGTSVRTERAPKSPRPQVTAPPRRDTAVDIDVVNEPRQNILNAIAWYNSVGVETPTRGHTALVAGVSPNSSGYEKNLSTLRTAGLVDYPAPNRLALTVAGHAVAEVRAEISTTDELIDVLEKRLGRPKGALLRALAKVYPERLTRAELAQIVDVSPDSSGFEKNLSGLRTLGFLDYPERGMVAATEMLFIDR